VAVGDRIERARINGDRSFHRGIRGSSAAHSNPEARRDDRDVRARRGRSGL